jgi:hypothetical protein
MRLASQSQISRQNIDPGRGRHCAAPPLLTELAQSIFHAEKITLGTAG